MDILEIMKIPYYKNGSGIHIKEKNRGKFTKSAKEHNMGVQEFATHILNNKNKYSSTLVKRANFAHNAKKFKHAKGGQLIPKHNTGNPIKWITNKSKYIKNYAKGKLDLFDSYIVDLSKENVSRITKDNEKESKSLLWNDYVELQNNNGIRKVKDWENTNDLVFGDNNIPISNITTYYGIEDGKLKAGNLSTFNSDTEVIPNRAKYIGKVQKIINNDNENTSFDSPYLAITQNNDTIPLPINPSISPKMVFANEQGDGVFINNLYDDNIRDSLNVHLNNTPMYPILIDNGQYTPFYPEGEKLDVYSGVNKPENMFIIGTIKK